MVPRAGLGLNPAEGSSPVADFPVRVFMLVRANCGLVTTGAPDALVLCRPLFLTPLAYS